MAVAPALAAAGGGGIGLAQVIPAIGAGLGFMDGKDKQSSADRMQQLALQLQERQVAMSEDAYKRKTNLSDMLRAQIDMALKPGGALDVNQSVADAEQQIARDGKTLGNNLGSFFKQMGGTATSTVARRAGENAQRKSLTDFQRARTGIRKDNFMTAQGLYSAAENQGDLGALGILGNAVNSQSNTLNQGANQKRASAGNPANFLASVFQMFEPEEPEDQIDFSNVTNKQRKMA